MTSVGILPSVCNDTVFPHCFSSRFSTIHFMGFLVALALLRTLLSFLRASLSSFLYHVPDPRTVLLVNFPKYATSIQYAYSLIPHLHSCPPFPAVLVAFSIIHEALSLQVSPSSEPSLPARGVTRRLSCCSWLAELTSWVEPSLLTLLDVLAAPNGFFIPCRRASNLVCMFTVTVAILVSCVVASGPLYLATSCLVHVGLARSRCTRIIIV